MNPPAILVGRIGTARDIVGVVLPVLKGPLRRKAMFHYGFLSFLI